MLLINGTLGILQGATAVAKDKVYVTTPRYAYQFDLTSWGWIHIVLGALAIVVGAGLLADKVWARWAGVVIAALSLVFSFMWLPYYPVWAVVIIAIDGFIIWGLSTRQQVSNI
jgi:hypothetical protein